ncbi:MAG TPA: hypothetical protein VJ953_20590 [Saprospiraceae bacterium]|nr:hypothetical protein [Saprospiraceae bacterium]
MDLKQVKLDLIKAISRCDDPALLSTVAEILDLDQSEMVERPSPQSQDAPPWDLPDSSEADELQQSIDDIFNP